MIHISKNIEETSRLAGLFLESILKNTSTTVVLLQGDLGAGKTAFVQALAGHMGIQETITSPTFFIQKRYQAEKYFSQLIHIDAYRLSSGEEIKKIGFDQTLAEKDTLVCIEWGDNIQEALPKNVYTISCRFIDETTHEYDF